MMRRKWWMVLLGVVLIGAVLVVGALVGAALSRRSVEPAAVPVGEETRSASPSPTPSDFVEFEDEEVGFAVAYPTEWERLDVADEQVKLLVTPNVRDSFLVRVVPLEATVGPDDLATMKEISDEVVLSAPGVELVQPARAVELGGLPGYVYVYTFTDESTGQQGVHSHYLLFDGSRLFVMVFQALPEERFVELAPTFDRIAATFRTLD